MSSKLLLDENPLLIMPKLACTIGLNESIVLQQIHYWIKINEKTKINFKDGFTWTYNSYKEWQEQFPFWSVKTIQRTINSLEEKNLIIIGNYNKLKIDRTKWYRINHQQLENLENMTTGQNDLTKECSSGQNDLTKKSKCPHEEVNLTNPLPKTKTETKTKNNIYITLTSNGDERLFLYNSYYKAKFNKEHMKIKDSSYIDVEIFLGKLDDFGVEIEDFEDAVKEHFSKLPKSNNGNILAFIKASKRYLEIDPEDPYKIERPKTNSKFNSFSQRKYTDEYLKHIEAVHNGWEVE